MSATVQSCWKGRLHVMTALRCWEEPVVSISVAFLNTKQHLSSPSINPLGNIQEFFLHISESGFQKIYFTGPYQTSYIHIMFKIKSRTWVHIYEGGTIRSYQKYCFGQHAQRRRTKSNKRTPSIYEFESRILKLYISIYIGMLNTIRPVNPSIEIRFHVMDYLSHASFWEDVLPNRVYLPVFWPGIVATGNMKTLCLSDRCYTIHWLISR